jgi:hypothetical protein
VLLLPIVCLLVFSVSLGLHSIIEHMTATGLDQFLVGRTGPMLLLDSGPTCRMHCLEECQPIQYT